MASLENATHKSVLAKVSEIFLRCEKVEEAGFSTNLFKLHSKKVIYSLVLWGV